MNVLRLCTIDVTITHVAHTGAVDAYNNPTESTTTSTVKGELQQVRRDEENVDANVQGETWLLILEPSATIDGTDRITASGVTYELVGPPWRARHPRTGEFTHWEATVRRAA